MEGQNVRKFMTKKSLCDRLGEFTKNMAMAAKEVRKQFCLAVGDGVPELLASVSTDTRYWEVFYAEDDFYNVQNYDSSMHSRMHAGLAGIRVVREYSAGICSFVGSKSPEYSVDWYEQKIKGTLGLKPYGKPRFDLIILKLENDGKVAGLHPNHDILKEETRLVSLVTNPTRCTFTLPLLNAAANVVIVATGTGVHNALTTAFEDPAPDGSSPAQLIKPDNGNVLFFTDFDAMEARKSGEFMMFTDFLEFS